MWATQKLEGIKTEGKKNVEGIKTCGPHKNLQSLVKLLKEKSCLSHE